VTAWEGPGLPRDAADGTAGAPSATAAPVATEAPPVVPRTRAGTVWVAFAVALALLVVVLVFILENLHSANVGFFGAHWRIPLGLDLLLAAVLGGLVVFLLGAVRIFQLRRVARRHHRARVRAESAAPAVTKSTHVPGRPPQDG
jgi:uncharacterized integral membrane protein